MRVHSRSVWRQNAWDWIRRAAAAAFGRRYRKNEKGKNPTDPVLSWATITFRSRVEKANVTTTTSVSRSLSSSGPRRFAEVVVGRWRLIAKRPSITNNSVLITRTAMGQKKKTISINLVNLCVSDSVRDINTRTRYMPDPPRTCQLLPKRFYIPIYGSSELFSGFSWNQITNIFMTLC